MKSRPITLGILGGGQLGRMSALAAARLGIKVHIYTFDEGSPASQVAAKTFVGEYGDNKKLKKFAESVDFASYEFENIPVETVRYIREFRPVYPDCRLLEAFGLRVNTATPTQVAMPTTALTKPVCTSCDSASTSLVSRVMMRPSISLS